MNQDTIIIVSSDEQGLSRLVQNYYNQEANKMEVAWLAQARTVSGSSNLEASSFDAEYLSKFGIDSIDQTEPPAQLKPEELDSSTMTIYLKESGSEDKLSSAFPNARGKYEIWQYDSRESLFEVVQGNISKLLVLFIMKGGKRTPIEKEEPQKAPTSKPKEYGKVRVCLEKKKRRGKKVTTITGLPLEEKELYKLAASLKQSCGTGGTVKNDCIEIQGDQCDKILAELQNLGYKAKRSGG